MNRVHQRTGVSYISQYASAHPWEDWAETWAHYLHMMDTLDTAYHAGLRLEPNRPSDPAMKFKESPIGSQDFEQTLINWFALSYSQMHLIAVWGLKTLIRLPYPIQYWINSVSYIMDYSK